jgi:protein arginine N-methyltransferase 1
MYSIPAFGRLIANEVRMGAYDRALREAVRPGCVVLDIGAGTGILSLLACKYGARKVYAVEPANAISLAREAARANGFDDRIEFFQALSTDLTFPEKADVVVSDLRGVLPLFTQHIPSIVDARTRLLAPGGILIPQRDILWAAVAESFKSHDRLVSPWDGRRFDLNLWGGLQASTNRWVNAEAKASRLLSKAHQWGVLDYTSIISSNVAASLVLPVTEAGVGHGLLLWFDAEIADGIGFSNAPAKPDALYGSAYFPWPEAVPLAKGDTVFLRIRADLTGDDYVWSWDSEILAGAARKPKACFRQSTFLGEPMSLQAVRRRAASHRPTIDEAGRMDLLILGMMDGAHALEDIAARLIEQFPGKFASSKDALTRVANSTDKYG